MKKTLNLKQNQTIKNLLVLAMFLILLLSLTACKNSKINTYELESGLEELSGILETEETEEEEGEEGEGEGEEESEESEETKETKESKESNEIKETVAETKEEIKETEKATEKATEAVTEAVKPAYKKVNDVKYAKSNVNVRSGPGTSYKKLGSLKTGQKVTRIGVCDNGWGVIDFNGKEGYVSGNYLVDSKPEPKPESKPEPKPESKPEPKPEPQPESTPPSSGREVPSGIPSGASYVEGDDQSHVFNYSSKLPNGGSVNSTCTNFIKGEVMISGTDNSGHAFCAVYEAVFERSGVGFMFGPPDLDDVDESALVNIGIEFLSAYGYKIVE